MMCFGLKDRKKLTKNHCVIVLLDDTQLIHELHPSSTGQDLLDVVIKHLNLLETSYFGLKFLRPTKDGTSQSANIISTTSATNTTSNFEQIWLDMNTNAIKQLRHSNPMTVYFGVKYYASDPCKLVEEITRYQFFLQCKQDILQSRLHIHTFELAAELFAYAVQSELGDFDPQRHRDNYVAEFQFVPNQTYDMEQRVALYHQQLAGQVPATAELNFLDKIKYLDLYGCELHPIQYDEQDEKENSERFAPKNRYALGLNPNGVLVLRNKQRVAQYLWSRIMKTKCQGRCFLMDVIDNSSNVGAQQQDDSSYYYYYQSAYSTSQRPPASASSGAKSTASYQAIRHRFGFRLASKEASRKLRWSIEEHKSFYQLIHSTATLNQLARHQQMAAMEAEQQQQQHLMKFGHRFRNSIRSVISVGNSHHQQLIREQQRQQKLLRSSMKSLQVNAMANNANGQSRDYSDSSIKSAAAAAARVAPNVVRMPSRRYGNKSSISRTNNSAADTPAPDVHSATSIGFNSIGLPAPVIMPTNQHYHTMNETQRRQAMMLFSQQHHRQLIANNRNLGKSQTLRPVAKEAAAKQRQDKFSYYQQMMSMMAAAAGQQQHQATGRLPEFAIVPPGRHIVQPNIYKATSVFDGINQLDLIEQKQPSSQQVALATARAGRESPRSTKSALAPSAAIRLASKKLAKQQQQLFYGAGANGRKAQDAKPLLANEHSTYGDLLPPPPPLLSGAQNSLVRPTAKHQYENNMQPLYHMNGSPKSVRSARLVASHHKPPKSASNFNGNLQMAQLLHQKSKSTGENLHLLHKKPAARIIRPLDSESMLLAAAPPPPPDYYCADHNLDQKKRSMSLSRPTAKAAAAQKQIYLNFDQTQSLAGRNVAAPLRRQSDQDDDDYYCSRSDCSSIIDFGDDRTTSNTKVAPARKMQQAPTKLQTAAAAILRNPNESSQRRGVEPDEAANGARNNLVKNITNKQATPILLTMNLHDNSGARHQANELHDGNDSDTNNKAVQLLNSQRQQLNSSHHNQQDAQTKLTPPSSVSSASSGSNRTANSASSSTASSPKTNSGGRLASNQSTGSNNSATSGYYCASNDSTTGPASVDSDNTPPADRTHTDASTRRPAGGGVPTGLRSKEQQSNSSSRAKIALGSHSAQTTLTNNRLIIGQLQQRQQFYLGDSNNNNMAPDERSGKDQEQAHAAAAAAAATAPANGQPRSWSPLERIGQHQPASLKYVSFDV